MTDYTLNVCRLIYPCFCGIISQNKVWMANIWHTGNITKAEKMKIINLRFPKDKYEQEVEPFIQKSGMKTATFIKVAINEKIIRDFPEKAGSNDGECK